MTTTHTTTAATYRKTKSGEWVAFGPAAIVKPGLVTVAKKNGTSKVETVTRVGRAFDVNGTACVYGYLGQSAPAPAPTASTDCDNCFERRATTSAIDSSGISGRVCSICARYGRYELSFA